MENKERVCFQVLDTIVLSSCVSVVEEFTLRITHACQLAGVSPVPKTTDVLNQTKRPKGSGQRYVEEIIGSFLEENYSKEEKVAEFLKFLDEKIKSYPAAAQKALNGSKILKGSFEQRQPRDSKQCFDLPILFLDPLLIDSKGSVRPVPEAISYFVRDNGSDSLHKLVNHIFPSESSNSIGSIIPCPDFYIDTVPFGHSLAIDFPKATHKPISILVLRPIAPLASELLHSGQAIVSLRQVPSKISNLKSRDPKTAQKAPVTVGYVFSEEKISALFEMGLLFDSPRINYVAQDPRLGSYFGEDLSVIFHKAQDFLKSDHPESILSLGSFDQIYKKNSDGTAQRKLRYVDDPNDLLVVMDRGSFQEAFQTLSKEMGGAFLIPKAIQVDPKTVSVEELLKKVGENQMKFPLLAKTCLACSKSWTHVMGMVRNEVGLKELRIKEPLFDREPHIFQELVSHDGVIFKAYMVGTQLSVVERQSIPNMTEASWESTELKSLVFFDSQKPIEKQIKVEKASQKPRFNEEIVKQLCQAIQEKCRIHIFGLDVIVETDGDAHYLIDLNYFPGFKKAEGIAEQIEGFLLK